MGTQRWGRRARRKEGGSPTHPEPSSGSRAGPCGCCDCSSIYRCAGGCMLPAPRPGISSLLQRRCGAGCLQLVLIRPLSGSSPPRASSLCSAAGGRGSRSGLVKGTWQRGRAHLSGRKLLPAVFTAAEVSAVFSRILSSLRRYGFLEFAFATPSASTHQAPVTYSGQRGPLSDHPSFIQ